MLMHFRIYFKSNPTFVIGDSLSLADIALAVALVQLSMVSFDLTPYPHISAWFTHISSTDAFKASQAPLYALARSKFGAE